MKNLLKLLGVILISTTLLTSCVTTNRGYNSSPVISRNVQLDPIKADIVVSERAKLSGEGSATYFLFFRVGGDRTYADGIYYSSEESSNSSSGILQKLNPLNLLSGKGKIAKVRNAAAYKALRSGEYDFLVHPTSSITVKNYLIIKKYEAKVEGYGAKYANFHTEKQKIVILQDGKEIIVQDNK